MGEPERQVRFRKASEDAWTVLLHGVPIGRVVGREAALANRGLSRVHAGWPQRVGRLWDASVEGATELDADAAEDVALWLKRNRREKRNRRGAVNLLLKAYAETGTSLPEPPEATQAA